MVRARGSGSRFAAIEPGTWNVYVAEQGAGFSVNAPADVEAEASDEGVGTVNVEEDGSVDEPVLELKDIRRGKTKAEKPSKPKTTSKVRKRLLVGGVPRCFQRYLFYRNVAV